MSSNTQVSFRVRDERIFNDAHQVVADHSHGIAKANLNNIMYHALAWWVRLSPGDRGDYRSEDYRFVDNGSLNVKMGDLPTFALTIRSVELWAGLEEVVAEDDSSRARVLFDALGAFLLLDTATRERIAHENEAVYGDSPRVGRPRTNDFPQT